MLFHPDYSCGTAAAKGSKPLCQGGEYYWEIKMNSAVYGTDMVSLVLRCSTTVTDDKEHKKTDLEEATDDLTMLNQH